MRNPIIKWGVLATFICFTNLLAGQYQIIPAYNTQQINNMKEIFRIYLINQSSQSQEVFIRAEVIGRENNIIAIYRSVNIHAKTGQTILNEGKFKPEQIFEPGLIDRTGSNIYTVKYYVITVQELGTLYDYTVEVSPVNNSIQAFTTDNNCSVLLSWSPSPKNRKLNYQLVITDCNNEEDPLFSRNQSSLTKNIKSTSYLVYPDNKTIFPGKKYCWEVLYVDKNNNILDRSEKKEFEIKCGGPDRMLVDPVPSYYYKFKTFTDNSYYLKEAGKAFIYGKLEYFNSTYTDSLEFRIKDISSDNSIVQSGTITNIRQGDNYIKIPVSGSYTTDKFYLLEVLTKDIIYYIKFKYIP